MNDDDFMDITPDVHFLQSVRADRGSWSALIAEGVDNAFDADATKVEVRLHQDSVVIADNGRGISKDRESAIVRLGEHAPMPGTKLGRFGMGIKYNACSAGDILTVDSLSADGHMLLTADWPKIIRSGRWRIPKSQWSPKLVSRDTGTTIQIARLVWERPKEKDVVAVSTYLAQTFYPAIEGGATIGLNGSAIPLLHEPALSDVVDQTIQLPNGKGAHVRGGILLEPDAPIYQVQVSYKHRVIKAKSTFGCGDSSGTRRMFARVTLTADWGLSRFKDDLVDPSAEALDDAVKEVLQPILDKCQAAQLEVKVDELTELLNDLLPPEIQAARPPRTRERVAQPTTTKRQHRPHGRTKEEPAANGPARMPGAPDNRIRITFDGPLCAEHGYGVYIKGRPNRITLARDNPDIAALLAQRDTNLAVRCLFGLALMIYHHAQETEPGQKRLPYDAEASFGLRVWRTAALQTPAAESSVPA